MAKLNLLRMSTLQARLKKAIRLAEQKHGREIKDIELARVAGVTKQSVHQWRVGPTREIKSKYATPLCEFLEVRVKWLNEGKGPMRPNVVPAPKDTGKIPVIDYIQAGNWSEVVDAYPVGGSAKIIYTEDVSLSESTFALEIRGDSMEPEYREGDIVVIDPTVAPRPGDEVVAKLASEEAATFKRYRPRGRDAKGREIIDLVPLNEDWPTLTISAENPGNIIGVMMEHRKKRRR